MNCWKIVAKKDGCYSLKCKQASLETKEKGIIFHHKLN